jgi:hypothetical protein
MEREESERMRRGRGQKAGGGRKRDEVKVRRTECVLLL